MTANKPRVQPGVPTGGQFAPVARQEPDVLGHGGDSPPPEADKQLLSRVGKRINDVEEGVRQIYDPSSLMLVRPIDGGWTGSATIVVNAMADDLLQDGPYQTTIIVWDCDPASGDYWVVRSALLYERDADGYLRFSKDGREFRVDVESNLMAISY